MKSANDLLDLIYSEIFLVFYWHGFSTSFKASRETGALKEAKDKLEKKVEELGWRLQLEKRARVMHFIFLFSILVICFEFDLIWTDSKVGHESFCQIFHSKLHSQKSYRIFRLFLAFFFGLWTDKNLKRKECRMKGKNLNLHLIEICQIFLKVLAWNVGKATKPSRKLLFSWLQHNYNDKEVTVGNIVYIYGFDCNCGNGHGDAVWQLSYCKIFGKTAKPWDIPWTSVKMVFSHCCEFVMLIVSVW